MKIKKTLLILSGVNAGVYKSLKRYGLVDLIGQERILPHIDLALDKATIGETYNVSGEKVYEINEIVNILRNLVNFKFEIWQDPSLIRTTDEPIIYGDSSKFKKETGWEQEIQLEKTLKDMLDYWREVL